MKDCINHGKVECTKGANKGKMHSASPVTKKEIKTLFNQVMAYAAESRLIERNYAKDFSLDKKVTEEEVAKRKKKRSYTEDEIQKLWDNIETVPFADMVIYACYSGWRPGELVEIKLSDINLEDGIITGGSKTEAGKGRIVPIHSKVMPIVKKYYNEAVSIGSEYLFNDNSDKRGMNGLSYFQYNARFSRVNDRLGIGDNMSPHDCRHTFITRAQAKGVEMNLMILKLIVGHAITDITESVYTHRTVDDLKEEMEKLK
jgi:integrase